MKKAGDLLSAIFDEKTLGKASECNKLFSTWEQLAKKHGIAAAAFHSHAQDIRHGILIIEADHPGWIQILQTKEHELLFDLQKMYPVLGIVGLAFKLGKTSAENIAGQESESRLPSAAFRRRATGRKGPAKPAAGQAAFSGPGDARAEEPEAIESARGTTSGLDKIKNSSLKEKLKNLENSIKANSKNR